MSDDALFAPARSPRLRRAARMAPDARREHLLRAAIHVFAAKGIGDARHTDVAHAAAVAVPTAFHYYPTKAQLLRAVLGEISRFLLEDIVAAHFASRDPAPAVIERILMTFCDAIDTHPDHVRVWLEWSVSIRKGLWNSYLVFYRKALALIGALIERGQAEGVIEAQLDVEDAARVIVGLAHMIVQMKFSGSSRTQVINTVHSLMHGYLEAHSRPTGLAGN